MPKLSYKPPKVFISYAWEDDIKTWVRNFSARLRSDGVETILDQWEVVPGDQLPEFMETSVRASDFVLVICTPMYKNKSDSSGPSGVGYEKGVITGELFVKRNQRKFIPVLRKGKWINAAPSWVLGKNYIDLRANPYNEDNYQDLLRTLYDKRDQPPPLGKPPEFFSRGVDKKKEISLPLDKPLRFRDMVSRWFVVLKSPFFRWTASLIAFVIVVIGGGLKIFPTLLAFDSISFPIPEYAALDPSIDKNRPMVYVSNQDGNEEIYSVNSNGLNQVRLTNNPASDVSPSTSFDGKNIVFQTIRDGNDEIYSMNSDGSKQVNISNNLAADASPSISSDGKSVAFISNRDGDLNLYKMDIDGSNVTRLTTFCSRDPSWSHDGHKIAFASCAFGNMEIYIMNADGTELTQITKTKSLLHLYKIWNSNPSWAPDDKKLVFTGDRGFILSSNSTDEIYMINIDGSGLKNLTNNTSYDFGPSWSVGGHIAFFSERDGGWNLFIMNYDGSNVIQITNNSGYSPKW